MPKPPSPSPKEKRAGELVEPVETLDPFAEDEAIVFDVGAYTPKVDMVEGLERGKLLFDLHGFKMTGTFSLARGKGRPVKRGQPWLPSKTWMLQKKPGAGADEQGVYANRSVLSGLAPNGEPAVFDLGDTPSFDVAAEPRTVREERAPFSEPDWFFELDPGGERVVATKRCELPTEIAGAIRAMPWDVAIDGQIVVLDTHGRPDAIALSSRLRGASTDLEHPAVLFASDLLALDGRDLRGLPLRRRKELLRQIVPPHGPLMFADHIVARGDVLAAEIEKRGGFGVIARRASGTYEDGAWVRVRLGGSSAPAPAAAIDTRGLEDLRIRLTNLDKVFWPADGRTKGDLLRYYFAVHRWLLPHLEDRPLVLTRFPDGIEGKSFFQHNAPGAKSEWLRTVRIATARRPRDYFLADDVESLLYLVNLGTIPLHVWPSRVDSLESPDWCTIDVDAGEHGFGPVVETALAVKALADRIEVPTFVKTSGGAGLHVVVPLENLGYDQSRAFGELIARTIASAHPKRCTVELQIANRGGRVFLDHMVNARGRMLVAPYAVRAKPGAPVSTPLDWSEVDDTLDPASFDITTVPLRLAERGDPWADFRMVPAQLGRALDLLSAER